MKNSILPNKLKKGDKISLISTARKIDIEKLVYTKEVLNNWGLTVIEGKNLRADSNQFCGTDVQRASDLQDAINDNSIKAIICFRGGYGTVRILESVDFSNLIKSPKWICGYSDVTALHNYLNSQCNIATMHSTMPVNFETNSKEALDTFRKALFGEKYTIHAHRHSLNREGDVSGKIIGGNLSMLYSLSGTKYDIDTRGKILFIEDLDEYLYHVDRMMWNLKLSGKLNNLVGLIVGGMTEMNDNDILFGKQAVEIIKEAAQEYNYPICFNFPCGHIEDNRALILNKEAKLLVGPSSVILEQ
jgi:muramoyltetrapeptide carboxypeptidase